MWVFLKREVFVKIRMAGVPLAVVRKHAGRGGRGWRFAGWVWVGGVVCILHRIIMNVGKEHRWGWRVLAVRTFHGWGCEFATWGWASGANLTFTD
ncbi:hypothetical protein DSO57_1034609 [Entomophthora muscae]|uniref:Uncharacterized protein n=1 Tax=Entomophthora muscae TaxID=34485 RepID=A0ACC2T0P3_9FUNG|nr:hypothetical protein DSO57_1034609 [Entomophthora muscae]